MVAGIVRPAEAFFQRGGNVVELERRVAAIPAEHAESREVAVLLMEMGEGKFALIGGFVTEGRDEQKVGGIPCGGLGFVGRGALLDDEVAEDAAENDDGEFLFLELDEEHAPRLAVLERAKLVDGLYLHGILVLEAHVSGLILEGEVVEAVFPERPVQFGFKVADELGEGLERVELVGGGGHDSVEFHPAFQNRGDADGGLQWAEDVAGELLLGLPANLGQQRALNGTRTRGFRRGPDEPGDGGRLGEDLFARQVVAGPDGEAGGIAPAGLAGFGVNQGGVGARNAEAEEHRARAGLGRGFAGEGLEREAGQGRGEVRVVTEELVVFQPELLRLGEGAIADSPWSERSFPAGLASAKARAERGNPRSSRGDEADSLELRTRPLLTSAAAKFEEKRGLRTSSETADAFCPFSRFGETP